MKGGFQLPAKHTHEYVESFFKKNGCILLSEYTHARDPLNYICICGNTSKISFDNFKHGKRCKKCGLDKLSSQFKHDYDYIFTFFEENGCHLLSKDYINGHRLLDYVCECGNISKIRFLDFRKGQRCWNCRSRKIVESQKLDYGFVYQYFLENNCMLLSEEYNNAHQKLDYICECGEKSEIAFDKFSSGQRCKKCGIKKYSGDKHYKYNDNLTDEERINKRNYPEYRDWASKVKERDNYTCQKCKQVGYELVSHHIENYSDNPNLRLDIDNGITLCKSCHIEFHKLYGYRNTNKDQLIEFLPISQPI